MKKTILLAALALGACQTTSASDVIAQAQADAVKVCGYLPAAETVTGILAAGNPLLATGEAIANAICAAVKSPTAGPSGPMVAGTPVRGRFVR